MFSGGTNIARIQKTKTPRKFKESYDELERSKEKKHKIDYKLLRKTKEMY